MSGNQHIPLFVRWLLWIQDKDEVKLWCGILIAMPFVGFLCVFPFAFLAGFLHANSAWSLTGLALLCAVLSFEWQFNLYHPAIVPEDRDTIGSKASFLVGWILIFLTLPPLVLSRSLVSGKPFIIEIGVTTLVMFIYWLVVGIFPFLLGRTLGHRRLKADS